jgi:uncharacterized surface protein with fasciclin (FAS1) repeats
MPAIAQHFWTDIRAPDRKSAFIVAGASLIVAAGVWGAVGARAQAGSTVAPLYPTEPQALTMIEVPNLSVWDVVNKLPITSRFAILLSNSGVENEIMGDGPYTVFAPADNYFDYLPKGAYVSLSRSEEHELAEHAVVANAAVQSTDETAGTYLTLAQDRLDVATGGGSLSAGSGFAIRGYHAKNGVVYIINKVLIPDDLAVRF